MCAALQWVWIQSMLGKEACAPFSCKALYMYVFYFYPEGLFEVCI